MAMTKDEVAYLGAGLITKNQNRLLVIINVDEGAKFQFFTTEKAPVVLTIERRGRDIR